MNNHKSTKVSFSDIQTSSNVQSQNSNQWIADLQEPLSDSLMFFSDIMESSSSNGFYKNTNTKDIDNNKKRNCSKVLLISVGILLSLIVFAAFAINTYLLIYINNTTTTTSTISSTSKVCVIGDTSITFDNLIVSTVVPNGYYNILWTNAYVYTETVNNSGYYTGIVSRPNIIYNAGGYPMTMKSATGRFFSFYSAAITAAWNDNLQLSVVGYKSNTIIKNNTFSLQVFTVSYLTFTGYTTLDTIVFTSYGGTQNPMVNGSGVHFVMDNICLSFA